MVESATPGVETVATETLRSSDTVEGPEAKPTLLNPADSSVADHGPTAGNHSHSLRTGMLAALGVVYGDIGTSPLYTLREAFRHGLELSEFNILGLLSMIVWSLIIVVTIKYVVFVMRADNRGEGGILTLAALATRANGRVGMTAPAILLGIVGVSLFYGETIITPAISVLSAIEGLEIAAPALENLVIPAAIAILAALFIVQRRGTAGVGRLFGPVMALWFATLTALGISHIVVEPGVLRALSPTYAVAFWQAHQWAAFIALGAVVLAITGVEALYADMGHLGRQPIRLAWLGVVLPALMMNYLGQGALLLHSPDAIENPFYRLAPEWGVIPLLMLATGATVIASQAVISGAFSLTRQAIQLGLIPRLRILHTSESTIGEIYVPWVNWLLLSLVILLVLTFESSSALAGAYGAAVTGTMVITSLLFFIVVRRVWKWSTPLALAVTGMFLIVDVAFFGANLLKIFQGGWFPLLMAAILFLLMQTWRRGRRVVEQRLSQGGMAINLFLDRLKVHERLRVPGTAVFLSRDLTRVPQALLHNVKHNKILHERVVLLTVEMRTVPRIAEADRCVVTSLGLGFYTVVLSYGYTETPDVPMGLTSCAYQNLRFEHMDTSFFVGRETLVPSSRQELGWLQTWLFIVLANNAADAADFFNLPANRVVELGTQIDV